jgi:hypothetical protein
MDAIGPATVPLDIQRASKILNGQETAMKATIEQLDAMQKEHDTAELTLKMPRKERIKTASELYRECYEQQYKDGGVKTAEIMIMGGCALSFFGGAAAGGMNGLLFIGLALTGLFGPLIAKSMIVSDKKVDAIMQEKLNERHTQLEQGMESAKKHLEEIKAKIIANISGESANQTPAGTVDTLDEEPDYILIDGVKLEKKKEGHMEFLPSFMRHKESMKKP